MATRIDIISGLYADGSANKFVCCDDGCATNVSTFQNVHNSDLNVTTFNISDAGTGFSVSIIAINGGAPTFPFFIAEGDTFTMEFEICNVGPATSGTWAGYFDTVEHAPDTPFGFTMSCVPVLYFNLDPTSIDFVDAPVGIPVTQTITSGTGGMLAQTLTLTGTGCENVVVNPSPIVVPQQEGPFTFDVTWTPATAGETLSCSLEFCSGETITVTGNSVELACENCLCCVDITVKTENGYLPDVSGLCNDGNLYSTASFLERKTVVFSLVYPSGINSQWQLQFNPGLFLRLCDSPFVPGQLLPAGYTITYLQSFMPDGVAQPMSLTGTAGNAANRKNWECTFTPVNAALGTFQIELTFFNLQDLENFITPTSWDNLGKLTRNTISAPTDWTNSTPSVYNANKVISGAIMVVDPNVLDENFNFTRCQFVSCANYTGRFYNLGLYNQPSEFLNPTWQLSRNIGPVTGLSTLEKTNVRFTITIPGTFGAGEPVCIYHLFDVTNFDNTVDFLTSSDSSRFRVAGYGGTGVLDNHLVRPGSVVNISGDWVFNLYVGTTVNPSSRYRMAAIVYDSDGTMVNTFLSNEWRVQTIPDFDCDCELDINSTFQQYFQNTAANAFQPSPKERIGQTLTIDGGPFVDCLENWGYTGDWRDLIGFVRLNIYKRQTGFPNPPQTTFFQYETHVSSRDVGFAGNFNNQNNMIVLDNTTGGLDVTISNRRVRWQNIPFNSGIVQTANTASYMNRVSAGAMSSTLIATAGAVDSWIGYDVFFEYTITFNLAPITGSPFLWNIVRAFPVRAIDFEPFSGFGNYLEDVAVYGRTSLTGTWTELDGEICFKDFAQIRLVYQADREGNFIFFAEPAPFGLPVLQENNEVPSPQALTQLTSPLVVSMDTVFDPALFTAEVILDAQQMTADNYLFCGYISTPEAPTICERFVQHRRNGGTGVGVPSITQYGIDCVVNFIGTNFGYLWMWTTTGFEPNPIPGQTYVFEWSFASPTTAVLEFWFGQHSNAGTPLTLPIGSTSGSQSVVWGASTAGAWTMRKPIGPVMTNTGTFRIGNTLCP
jgi:hypothetical protein